MRVVHALLRFCRYANFGVKTRMEIGIVSKFQMVMRRLDAGAKVRIVQDRYGQKKVELTRSWLPIRSFVDLERNEISLVEVALSSRGRRAKQQPPIKV